MPVLCYMSLSFGCGRVCSCERAGCVLRMHCSSTGPVVLVFNYHLNFLSVTGHDLLNESNTFTLNPKPVVLWHLFEPKAIFFSTCCMCYSKRG